MKRCEFIKPGGERCGAWAMTGYSTCYGHRPDLAEERQRASSKAGKRGGRGRGGGGGSAETAAIRELLRELTEALRDYRIPTATAAVLVQVANARSRLVEVDRRIVEQDDLLARLEALEEKNAPRHGPRRGGVR